jgi:hypothetical protein
MATITAYGLEQEGRVIPKLCTTQAESLPPRGITPEFLTRFDGLLKDLEKKAGEANLAVERKETLSEQEEQKRNDVLDCIRKIQSIVKNVFPKGSAVWKAYHVGDQPNNSTKLILKWANDCMESSDEHKSELLANGLLQSDLDELKAEIALLKSIDADQEEYKKSKLPIAQNALVIAMDNVKAASDKIHAVAATAFKKNPEILQQFEAAKKLRYEVPARKPKQPPTTDDKSGAAPPAK